MRKRQFFIYNEYEKETRYFLVLTMCLQKYYTLHCFYSNNQ